MTSRSTDLYTSEYYPLPTLPNVKIPHAPKRKRPANALPHLTVEEEAALLRELPDSLSLSTFIAPPESWFSSVRLSSRPGVTHD
jgi:hypothetical protein